jgi:hypothetical protein
MSRFNQTRVASVIIAPCRERRRREMAFEELKRRQSFVWGNGRFERR